MITTQKVLAKINPKLSSSVLVNNSSNYFLYNRKRVKEILAILGTKRLYEMTIIRRENNYAVISVDTDPGVYTIELDYRHLYEFIVPENSKMAKALYSKTFT